MESNIVKKVKSISYKYPSIQNTILLQGLSKIFGEFVDYNITPPMQTFIIANFITRTITQSTKFKRLISKLSNNNKKLKHLYFDRAYLSLLLFVMYNLYNYILVFSLAGKIEVKELAVLINSISAFTQHVQIDFKKVLTTIFDNYSTLSVSSFYNTAKSILGLKNLGNVALHELLEIYNIGINTAISTALFSVTSSLSKSLPNLKTDVNKLVNALSEGTNIPSLKAINPSLDYIGKILKYLQEGMTQSALGVMSSYVKSVQTSEPETFIKTFTPLINGTISSIMNPTIPKSITSSINMSLGEGYLLSTFISESIGLQKIISAGSFIGSYTKNFGIYVWEWLAYLFFFPYERVKLIEQGGCIIGEPIQEIFTQMVSNSTNPVIETLSTNVEFKNFLNNTAKFACIEETNVALALNQGRQTIQNKFVPYAISNLNFNYFFIIAIILMFAIALFTPDQEDEPQEQQSPVESRFEEVQ